jgi:hypothetical protein
MRQIFAGGETGKPAFQASAVVMKIIGAIPLKDDRLARAKVIALVWAISVEENAAFIDRVETIGCGWPAILVGFGWAGDRDNARSFCGHGLNP